MKHLRKKTNTKKPSGLPDVPEDFPFQLQFRLFLRALKKLPAETDTVNGTLREYMRLAALMSAYLPCFGADALAASTVRYRIMQLKPHEYPDDVLVLEMELHYREPRYFINRLNTALLERIFVPQIPQDIRLLSEQYRLMDEYYRCGEVYNEEEYDFEWPLTFLL